MVPKVTVKSRVDSTMFDKHFVILLSFNDEYSAIISQIDFKTKKTSRKIDKYAPTCSIDLRLKIYLFSSLKEAIIQS